MVRVLSKFRDLDLRKKLLIIYAIIFTISISIGGIISYTYAVIIIEQDVEEQLGKSTQIITKLIKTSATVSIRNYLRGLVEKNIAYLNTLNQTNNLHKAQADAVKFLNNQKISENGFLYCIDQSGRLVFVPARFRNPEQYSSLPIHIMREEGYFEYVESDYHSHRNRPKADFSSIYHPWQWRIVASSFRDELINLIDINDFKYIVLSQRIGKTGHTYIIDSKGWAVIHRSATGLNLIHERDSEDQSYIRKICDLKSGHLTYHSKSSTTNQMQENLVVFNYLAEFDWIVISETHLDEFYGPLNSIRVLIIVTVVALIFLSLPITYWLSTSITNPLNELMNRLELGISGDLSVRMRPHGNDEIGLLARYFNSFMQKLETNKLKLEKQMIARSKLEREILDISEKERYRIGQDLHDDLCPHLLGIEALCKVLTQKLADRKIKESYQIETIRDLVHESILKTRNLSKGLCPVFIGEQALESSLSDLAGHTTEVQGIECRFKKSGKPVRLNQSRASNLYYIARESVFNAVKHGQPSLIIIKLHTDGSRISLTIEDDGIGFDKSAVKQGLGLEIMKYRSNVINSDLTVNTGPEKGTKIFCRVESE